ncbi:MAG: AAA family ATPase [Deltaproteobacteria bacterium]|nr:AAA family ATPase [Deltaproteobacteria bacterium]MBI3387241.1 AAA family ATPase [Deltaproteobacteria bacterium]
MIHAFADFELDADLYQLRRGGQPVKLEPKVFNVLAHLITYRDRLVTKQELFERLWPGEFVSDSALTYCIKAARKAIGDDGTEQRVIATVHRRGYRFIAPVIERTSPTCPSNSSSPSERGAAVAATDSPFIGRAQVMATLQRALATAAGGRGQLLMLAGEPGIGKTRTADELAHLARTRGMRVLVGRCYEGEGAPPFWPWAQILRAHLLQLQPATLPTVLGHSAEDLAQLVPELAERLPGLARKSPRDDSAHARFQLFESVNSFLAAASRGQPLALILDDLHWADKPSLLLLQFIARAISDARVLILATYRDTDVRPQHPLAHALGDLVRAPNSQRIQLDGLEVDDVASFLEQALGHKPPVSLITAVHQETEGNPFFVTEVVRLLTRNGQVERLATDTIVLAVPPTVREAITRRLAPLSSECNRLLMAASVIGRQFAVATLSQALQPLRSRMKESAEPRTAVLDLLDEARAARIIDAVGQSAGGYRFVHALIRETLYDTLSTADRVSLHRRVGESLEQTHDRERGGHLTELAHHFAQAAMGGDARKGVTYSIRAAEYAASQLAYEEAATQYERALQLSALGDEVSGQRGELLLALGHHQWRAGDFARARATFYAAAVAARADRAPERFARAALGYGGGFRGFTLGVVDPVLSDLLAEALTLLPDCDSALRAQVTARQAVALYDIPNSLPQRDALSRAAVDMAQRMGDTASHLGALSCRHWAIWGPDNLDDRDAVANAMVTLAEEVGDHEMALQAHRFRLIDALEIGDIDRVHVDLAACEAITTRLRQPYYMWYVLAFRALQAFLAGRFSDSERFSQEALAAGQRAESRNVSQMYGAQTLALRREQGRIAEVEPMLQGLVAQFPTVPSWRCGLAYVLVELGRLDDARIQFEVVAADNFGVIPRDTFWLVAMNGVSDVCVALADRERADILYRLLLPYEGRNAVNVVGTCVSSMARSLGCLAALVGRLDDARRHFEAAIAMETRLGAVPLLAHTRHDYGNVLLRQGAAADRDEARQLLAAAVRDFEQLGMHSFARRAAQLLAHAQRPTASATASRSKVTALRRR